MHARLWVAFNDIITRIYVVVACCCSSESCRRRSTPASFSDIFDTVYRLVASRNIVKVLEVESKYRHLDTFSDNPVEDAFVLTVFGTTNDVCNICFDRAIAYYERAKVRMEDVNVNDQSASFKSHSGQNWNESCQFVCRWS